MGDLAFRVGETIAGRYRVERELGRGGAGVVLEATHLLLQERVAIKLLRAGAAARRSQVARLLREARLMARLRSEHVARVLDVGQTPDELPFVVIELLHGRDLAGVLAERGPLPWPEVARLLVELCEGLSAAHELGVVHRDLKPANLFVEALPTGRGRLKILDFGVSAMPSDLLGPSDATLTTEGALLGSPRYMAPEQIRDAGAVDARADLWAVGVVAYELLCGSAPFEGPTSAAVLAAIAADEPARLETRCQVPAAFADVVHRCLSKSKETRPASASALVGLLSPFAGDLPAPAVPLPVTPEGVATLDPAESVSVEPVQTFTQVATAAPPSSGRSPRPRAWGAVAAGVVATVAVGASVTALALRAPAAASSASTQAAVSTPVASATEAASTQVPAASSAPADPASRPASEPPASSSPPQRSAKAPRPALSPSSRPPPSSSQPPPPPVPKVDDDRSW